METSTLIKDLKDPGKRHAAFRILVEKYQQRLYWHIRRMVLDHNDADDVLQETFIRVYRSMDSFREDSALFTWMYRIATNEALNFLSKQARRNEVTAEIYLSQKAASLEADPYFEGDALQMALQKAMADLPEKQRLVFQMKYFDDLKYEDIASVLNTSVGALKASYHHASQKIREALHLNKENN